MNWPAYPEYKDSGVEWLGEVPACWNLAPLWTLFKRTKATGFPELELLSVYRDHGVLPKASRDDNYNKPSEDLGAYQRVDVGALVINKMKAWQGSVSVSNYNGIVSPAYFVYTPQSYHESRFLHYLLRSSPMVGKYAAISSGVRPNQWDLDPQEFSRLSVLLPGVDEQRSIALFLDRETGKIDALIDKQHQLIETLREDRTATITHAVTKGLNPNAEMKASGVEWIGQVPDAWSVQKFARLAAVSNAGEVIDKTWWGDGDEVLFTCAREPVASDFTSFPQQKRTTDNDILITRNATPYIHMPPGDSIYSNVVQRVTLPPGTSREWMRYCLESGSASMHGYGVSIDTFNFGMWRAIQIPVPGEYEQRTIAEHLSEETGRINALSDQARRVIDTLREYRSALITAAVTGKIDVREAV